jgi:hypothetical protein
VLHWQVVLNLVAVYIIQQQNITLKSEKAKRTSNNANYLEEQNSMGQNFNKT